MDQTTLPAIPDDMLACALELVDSGAVLCPSKHNMAASKWITGLAKDPGLFLELFGAQLPEAMLSFFDPLASESYVVRHFLKKLRRGDDHISLCHNRRLQAARTMLASSSGHFSDEAMAERDPSLFLRVMGASISDVSCAADSSGLNPNRFLSEMLLSAADGTHTLRRKCQPLHPQQAFAGTDTTAAFEPSPTLFGELSSDAPPNPATGREPLGSRDFDGVADDDDAKLHESGIDPAIEDIDDDVYVGGDADSLDERRSFLQRIMLRRFVAGADSATFDYRAIDDDTFLDTSVEAARDHEEAYFDCDD
jgi:hypothetical protein